MKDALTFPKLSFPAILSPMAGITDVAFRHLACMYGCGMTYTEFVNSIAITRDNKKAWDMLVTSPLEKPVAVQLFGSSQQDVVQAAQKVEDAFDVIDINCGCPAYKVIKTGAGSSLLNNPTHIASFINKLVEQVNTPITIKIRTGIDDKHINALTVAKAAQDAGASAIAIHGRTQKQGYSGTANWDIITQVKQTVDIPVIGNGDVFTPQQFFERLEQSQVDAIMIARGVIGNPYIFSQIAQYQNTQSFDTPPTDMLPLYIKIAQTYHLPFSTIKQQSLQFTKGWVGGAQVRRNLAQATTITQVQEIIDNALQNNHATGA